MRLAWKLLPLCVCLCFAEEVVRCTYGTEDNTLQVAGELAFSQYAMVIDAKSPNFSDIERVDYYDDQQLLLANEASRPIAVMEGFIGFRSSGGALNVTLPSSLDLTVSLYTPHGEEAAVLFCGMAESGELELAIGDQGLASGKYALVVSTSNALFVRNIVLR